VPKAYVIVTEAIHDPEGMRAYSRATAPTLADVNVLAADPRPEVLEGTWHGNRTVILEFESVEQARAWYNSPEYEKAKPLRHAAADSNAVIITGR
jgi:uncharacterized protein (DUF1330 family)